MQMKDVAKKLNNWKSQNIDNINVKQLIQIQKELQRYCYLNSDGCKGKKFLNIQYLNYLSEQQKVIWTKQNVLRIFDQLSQCLRWSDQMFAPSILNNKKILSQNLLFQFIDIMHFVFNIVIIWGIENKIKNLQSFKQQGIYKFEAINFDRDIRRFQLLTSELLNSVQWKLWKISAPTNKEKMIQIVNNLLQQILYIFYGMGYKTEDVYKMYVRKNKQNTNRQKQMIGYKN